MERPGAARWLDVHASTGITVFAFLALVSFTSLVIGFEKMSGPALCRVTGSAPSARPPHVVTPAPRGPIGLDRAIVIAAAAIPGAAPLQVTVPAPDGTCLVRMHFPEDLTPGGRSRVEVDQYTGDVVLAESSRTAPAGTRAIALNRAIHTGDVGGMPGRVAISIASALTARWPPAAC